MTSLGKIDGLLFYPSPKTRKKVTILIPTIGQFNIMNRGPSCFNFFYLILDKFFNPFFTIQMSSFFEIAYLLAFNLTDFYSLKKCIFSIEKFDLINASDSVFKKCP